MQLMPEAMVNLLKRRSMSGTNKPAYRLTIEDSPVGSLTDPTVWTAWHLFAGTSPARGYGNMVETSDERAAISYVEDGNVYIAFADTVAGVLNNTETFDFANATLIKSGVTQCQTSLSLIDGKLHLAITDKPDTVRTCEYWRDTDGRGDDFSFVSMISTDLHADDVSGGLNADLSPIQVLPSGVWIVLAPYNTDAAHDPQGQVRVYYSSNKGASWTAGVYTYASILHRLTSVSKSILPLDDGRSFVLGMWCSATYSEVEYIKDNGATYDWRHWGDGWPYNYMVAAGWCKIDDKYYMAINSGGTKFDIYQLKAAAPTIDNILDRDDWTFVCSVTNNGTKTPIFTPTNNALILQHTDSDEVSGAGTLVARRPLTAKKIEVRRQKGAASVLTVVLDNKGGRYSPDKINSDWFGVIWPNKRIVLRWGYGSDLAYGFTGLVDRVKSSSFPAELTITCRDMLKLALDQTVTDELGGHTIYYTNETIENIFLYLANAAGYISDDIVYEPTGITLEGFLVSNETYADAFTRLCELCGFEYYCDAQGKLYFVRATDRSPQQEDALTLSGTDPVVLSKFPIVTDSIQVWSGPEKTGTEYTLDVDYVVTEGDSETEWQINRIAGSSMPDNVYASYVYAAAVFKEGLNIFKCDYAIDDKDLYYQVVVQGAEAEGEGAIEATADYISRDYYNILPQKILIVTLSQLKTLAECQAAADKNEVLMRAMPRYIEWGAIANPWIDAGDCVQVVESTSTASEIYRAPSETITMEPESGFVMQLGAYHYGYSPAA